MTQHPAREAQEREDALTSLVMSVDHRMSHDRIKQCLWAFLQADCAAETARAALPSRDGAEVVEALQKAAQWHETHQTFLAGADIDTDLKRWLIGAEINQAAVIRAALTAARQSPADAGKS